MIATSLHQYLNYTHNTPHYIFIHFMKVLLLILIEICKITACYIVSWKAIYYHAYLAEIRAGECKRWLLENTNRITVARQMHTHMYLRHAQWRTSGICAFFLSLLRVGSVPLQSCSRSRRMWECLGRGSWRRRTLVFFYLPGDPEMYWCCYYSQWYNKINLCE